MKEIVSVGFQFPSTDTNFHEINERVSLSDADIIIFSPNIDDLYQTEYSNLGKRCYDKESSFKLRDDFIHWKSELSLALKQGKTIFIFLKEKEEFNIHTGKQERSGTGRNQSVTNFVDLFDNYKWLPTSLNIQSASGKNVYCSSPLFQNFYNAFQKELNFEAYINSESIKDFSFTTKSKDRCLGATLKLPNGYMIFLPMLNSNKETFWKQNEEPSKAGIEFGKRLVSNLVEIDKALRSNTEKTPKPDWLNNENYELKEAAKTKKAIQSNIQKIKKIESENIQLNNILIEQESLTDLLYEGGKALEDAVIKALKILGYNAENYNDGVLELDQIISSPENERFIGECEGKENKDIDVGKFRQLQDSLNEDFQREEVEEKAFGLLFGNPQRLINPTERTLDFTKKCKLGAEREKIGLIKTTDLFTVVKYLSENEDENYKVECRKTIKNQLGNVIQFPKLPTKTDKSSSKVTS